MNAAELIVSQRKNDGTEQWHPKEDFLADKPFLKPKVAQILSKTGLKARNWDYQKEICPHWKRLKIWKGRKR